MHAMTKCCVYVFKIEIYKQCNLLCNKLIYIIVFVVELLAPPAERQRSFSNAELSVRLSV